MEADYLVVLVTLADAEAGVALGRTLVEEALAACVQVIPGGTAIYRWQGQLNTDAQVQLIIKTRRTVWPCLRERIVELHDDEVPEILALPIVDGLPAYLRWLDEATTPCWLAEQPQTEVNWRPYFEVYPRGRHTVAGNIKIVQGFESPELENRRDILVYQTPPLEEPLTIAGPVSAVLYASSSAKDTDWFMRMSQVDPDGEVFWLTEGKVRARYRSSSHAPELLRPGTVYRYELDLWHTGIQIPAGSRLRIEVASASFPIWSRNLNTGGHNETETRFVKARQTVYHDPRYPSHVLLPVIPAGAAQ